MLDVRNTSVRPVKLLDVRNTSVRPVKLLDVRNTSVSYWRRRFSPLASASAYETAVETPCWNTPRCMVI